MLLGAPSNYCENSFKPLSVIFKKITLSPLSLPRTRLLLPPTILLLQFSASSVFLRPFAASSFFFFFFAAIAAIVAVFRRKVWVFAFVVVLRVCASFRVSASSSR